MVKIINIKCQGKKFHVTFEKDGTMDKIILLEDQIVTYRVFKDQVFTNEAFDEITQSASTNIMFSKAMNYASFQQRSRYEVVRFLVEKKASDMEIVHIIKKLTDYKLLDDEKYATYLLNDMIKKCKGPRHFQNLLKSKGFDDELIKEMIGRFPGDVVFEQLLNELKKEMKKVHHYPVKKQKTMLLQKYLRSGFKMETILKAFNQMTWNSDHLATMVKDFQQIKRLTNDRNKIITKMLQKGYQYHEFSHLVKD